MEFLLKLSAIIALFYLCYKFFLEGETFFRTNRYFLNIGLVAALLLPWVVIPVYITKEAPSTLAFQAVGSASAEAIEQPSYWSLKRIVITLYWSGVVLFGIRFLWQLASLGWLIVRNKKQVRDGFIQIEDHRISAPFSFFKFIAFNPGQFSQDELDQVIAHEKVHVREMHSLDLMAIQIMSIINWFNPFVWLYRKEIEQNLEYLADSEAQELVPCESAYQRLLLKASLPNHNLALVNNFYNSLIKKRIVMLHKSKSNKINQIKIALILPALALFLMSFNTKEIITYERSNSITDSGLMLADSDQDQVSVLISSDMSDKELENIRKKFEKQGVSLKFKGIKRNAEDKITKISIVAKTKNSSANFTTDDDYAIEPILIRLNSSGNISIGDNMHEHEHEDEDYRFETKDGKVKIKRLNKGNSIYVYSSDEDADEEIEVGNDKDVIIIKNGDKVSEVKVRKAKKDGNVFIHKGEGGEEAEFEIIELKEGDDDKIHEIIIESDGDDKVIKEWKEKGGKSVWISSGDKNIKANTVTIKSGDDDKLIIRGDAEDALIVVDGKIVDRKTMDKLDTDNIESINVIKGDKALEKYGEKAKNGVIEIKTKN